MASMFEYSFTALRNPTFEREVSGPPAAYISSAAATQLKEIENPVRPLHPGTDYNDSTEGLRGPLNGGGLVKSPS